jgi:hypothetical protein
MVFEFEDRDYEPVSGFRLLWRWTSPTHAEFPPSVLGQIQPIAGPKAALVNDALATIHRDPDELGPEAVRELRRLDTKTMDEGAVSEWLLGLPIRDDDKVIVSWDATTAVTAPFKLVAEYWSDFFYPASDDAVVLPLGAEWILVWHHEEHFEFRQLSS